VFRYTTESNFIPKADWPQLWESSKQSLRPNLGPVSQYP